MHIFVRTDRVLVVETAADATVQSVKRAVELRVGVPCAEQRLVYAGKQLEDGRTLVESGVTRDSTVHLVLRLLGGKGGFGALLRSGARASHTQNFDACRDLSGRRLRHVTADEKLAEYLMGRPSSMVTIRLVTAEWASEANDRELEKIALQHIKEQDKAAAREARVQVEVEEVREEHQQKLTTVLTAMHEALAASGNGALVPADGLGVLRTNKRSGSSDSTDSPSPPAKRRNRGFLPAAFDELSSDSDEDDTGKDAQAATTLAAAARGSDAAAEPDVGGKQAGPTSVAEEQPAAAGDAAPQHQEASTRGAARTLGSRAGDEQPAEPRDTARAVATATGNNNAGSEMTTAAGPERQASISGPRGSFVAGVRQASLALSATAPQAASPAGAVAVPAAAGSAAGDGRTGEAQRDGSGAESNGMTAASAAEPVAEIDVAATGSVEEMEACGLDALKAALQKRGLKAGGSAKERAARLWLLQTTPLEQLDRKHFAKTK